MKICALLFLMLPLFSGALQAQSGSLADSGVTTTNLVADPFAANLRKPELTPALIPVTRIDVPSESGVAYLPPAPTALPNIRLVMIRGWRTAWLSTTDNPKHLTEVRHGESVLLNNRTFFAEVSEDEVRLFSKAKGKLLWLGTLSGAVGQAQSETATAFVPPLSAGVSPGLRTSSASSNSPVIPKQ